MYCFTFFSIKQLKYLSFVLVAIKLEIKPFHENKFKPWNILINLSKDVVTGQPSSPSEIPRIPFPNTQHPTYLQCVCQASVPQCQRQLCIFTHSLPFNQLKPNRLCLFAWTHPPTYQPNDDDAMMVAMADTNYLSVSATKLLNADGADTLTNWDAAPSPHHTQMWLTDWVQLKLCLHNLTRRRVAYRRTNPFMVEIRGADSGNIQSNRS